MTCPNCSDTEMTQVSCGHWVCPVPTCGYHEMR